MEENEYNKIACLYQFLNNNYMPKYYQYGAFSGSYKGFKIEDIQLDSNSLELVDELEQLKVKDFYKIEYLLNNGFPEKYYDGKLVIKSKTEIGFHYQTETILFAYILFKLKDVVNSFLNLINSKEFRDNFLHIVKIDKYEIKYHTDNHKTVFKFISSRVENFSMLHHQLNWLTDMSYSDGMNTVYKIERLKNHVDKLDEFEFNYSFNINV